MPATAHYEKFMGEFSDAHMKSLPPGAIVLHAQVFPDVYPSDQPYVDQWREHPYTPIPHAPYDDLANELVLGGVSLRRLVVVRGSEDSGYDPEYIKIQRKWFAERQSAGAEKIHTAEYGRFIVGLTAYCGESSPFVQTYAGGVKTGIPKCSFWAIYNSGRANMPDVIGMMHYRATEGGDAFGGITLCEPPFTTGLLHYARFCRLTFAAGDDFRSLKIAA